MCIRDRVLAAAFLFCVLMAVCSGTTLDMVLSVIGVNLSFPILVYSCIYLIGCLLPGFSPSIDLGSTLFVALAPFVGIFLHTTSSSTFFVWWLSLIHISLSNSCTQLWAMVPSAGTPKSGSEMVQAVPQHPPI